MIAGVIILLVVALSYATVTDVRYRKIPNSLTFPVLAGGLALHTLESGKDGFFLALSGAGVALALMIVPFIFGWMGAGDVKLAVAVGSLTGASFVINTLLFAAVVAGLVVAFQIIHERQLVATARYLMLAWHVPLPKTPVLKSRLPYAPAMACGCLLAYFMSAVNIS